MSVKNKNKDHLKEHGGVGLAKRFLVPISDDPLRFWTHHPTESTLVDLYVFAEGELDKPIPSGNWKGPFSGRPKLIAEMAPAIQARLTLMAVGTCWQCKQTLRMFWRLCDQLEATVATDGSKIERLTSVQDLTHLHEAAMHRAGYSASQFGIILKLVNDSRRLMRLGPLLWSPPLNGTPIRHLIPDSHAKALKIGIKRDWERVRRTWERNDSIRRGEEPDTLTEFEKQDAATVCRYAEENEILRRNWQQFELVQKVTGQLHPTREQLYDGKSASPQYRDGRSPTKMRAIAFPTMEEAHIAFHAALIGSGWNPSTLITGINANFPQRIFQHPKDAKQRVLLVDEPEYEARYQTDGTDIEVTMQGSKRRAGGRLQLCMGLKKNPHSPPNIVTVFLERTKVLREQLRLDAVDAHTELERIRAINAPRGAQEHQFKKLQRLRQGLRNVWIYVSSTGEINWLDGKDWKAFGTPNASKKKKTTSYLDQVLARLNAQRIPPEESPIANVVPSDLRDIFARWVHLQTGGNIISVMFALGHSALRSTNAYLDNNIFSAENDATVHRFMTHLFVELEQGRSDLTILAQLVRNGALTKKMEDRLMEYRGMMRSRVARCADPKHPPIHIEPDHVEGKLCGTHRCLKNCPHARFLPDSLETIAMRVEELMAMSDHLPIDTWLRGEFEQELVAGEYLLDDLYLPDAVAEARAHWKQKILANMHVVPGVGIVQKQEAV